MKLLAFFREGPNRWINWYSDTDGPTWIETVFRTDDRVAGRAWFAVPYSEPGGVWDTDMQKRWQCWPYPTPLTDNQAIGLLELVRRRSPDGSTAALSSEARAAAFASEGLGCVFVRPALRPVLDRAWLTSTVVTLARGIRDEAASDRMPILADALQDMGCEEPALLAHCRGPGPHVRGCWVIDLLIGAEAGNQPDQTG
jgi:hypothetical protein